MTRSIWRVATAAAVALALGGCASIPVRGPVTVGDVEVQDSSELFLQVYGPGEDATPEQVVRGFVSAQAAGVSEGFETARLYLADPARESWDPTTQTVVYAGDLSLAAGPETPADDTAADAAATDDPDAGSAGDDAPGSEGTATPGPSAAPGGPLTLVSTLAVSATVDDAGRYTEAAAGATRDVTYTLVTDGAGQWRISDAPDGVVVSQPNFTSVYRATPLYFATPDRGYLVPDLRWFPRRNTATYAAQALLAGPSPWLRDAVVTGVPVGTTLTVGAVSVDTSGTAVVDLTAGALSASDQQRALLEAQVEATLLRVPGVSAVEVRVADSPLSVTTPVNPVRDPGPVGLPRAVQDGVVVSVDGRDLTPVAGIAPLAQTPTALAVSPVDASVVVRLGRQTLSVLPTDGSAPVPFLQGRDVLAPSIDGDGWVWSGSGDVDDALRLARYDGTEIALEVDWLAGQDVRALQVSRDGARVALISQNAEGLQIDVAGVVRDEAGTPRQLTEPVAVGARMVTASDVVWVDETTLAVVGSASEGGAVAVHTVTVGGQSEGVVAVEGVASIAAGRGTRSIYVVTASRELFTRSATGTNWSLIATGVDLFTFPG